MSTKVKTIDKIRAVAAPNNEPNDTYLVMRTVIKNTSRAITSKIGS